MSAVNCQVNKEKITVGEPLQLTCSGDIDSKFSLEKAEFKLAEINKYTVKLIKINSFNKGEANLDFTIYSPGEYKLSELILTDGLSEINLNGPAVKVESVLKPTSEGKAPEPFGPLLPIGIATPAYYYFFLASFFIVIILYGAYRIKRHLYYKKLKTKLIQHISPIDIDTQFYKSIRLAEKMDYPLDQIEKAFRLYNLRAYELPMFDLSNERILKYFKRNHPRYKNTRLSLQKLLDEFVELQKNNDLLMEEKNKFVKKLYRFVSTNKGLEQ